MALARSRLSAVTLCVSLALALVFRVSLFESTVFCCRTVALYGFTYCTAYMLSHVVTYSIVVPPENRVTCATHIVPQLHYERFDAREERACGGASSSTAASSKKG